MRATPATDIAAPELSPGVDSHDRMVRIQRRTKTGSGEAALTYSVIYADPPWRYDYATPNREIENHYPTMDLAEICCMEIPAAKDAVLYMWTTAPKLLEGISVMRAWGFRYRTHAVWDKEKLGMGYWFRGQHEILMVGTRGNIKTPAPELRISSVIKCPHGRHSAKPEYVRAMIEKWYPDAKRLELFSRLKRPGWDVFGNQVEYDLLSGAVAPAPLDSNDKVSRRSESKRDQHREQTNGH